MGMNLTAKQRAMGKSSMRPGDSVTERRPIQSNDVQSRVRLLAVRANSVTNSREHHMARSRRAKQQRQDAFGAFSDLPVPALPVVVELHRIGKSLLDDDNLQGAMKSFRDGIADLYGIGDNTPLIRWEYGQEKAREYAVRITITQITSDTVQRIIGRCGGAK